MHFVKKILIVAIVGGALFFLLSYHFIVVGRGVKLLKKSSLTLQYTIFSVKGKTNEAILSVDELREDGIGDLLVELGMMSEKEKERLEAKYDEEQD